MSWLLGADVVSEPARKAGDRRVLAWLEENREDCYISTMAIAQVAYWTRCVETRHRAALQTWLTRLQDSLEGRILSFNGGTALVWAEQKHLRTQNGRRMTVEDSYIAEIASQNGLTIVTGQVKNFRHCGVNMLNPFQS
jgi:predicted nucleic acid-binding protein